MTGGGDRRTRAGSHLRALCAGRDRRPGSAENRAGTAYVAELLARQGWAVAQPEFEVVGWEGDDGVLMVGGAELRLHTSPYSPGVAGSGDLVVASTLAELTRRNLAGAIVVLRGALTAQPLTPKGFPFYQVEDHRHLIDLLEAAGPTAIVAATGWCPEMAGAIHPFPFIEDGDFRVPTGYVDEQMGSALAGFDGLPARVALHGQRQPALACNVVGRRGHAQGRVTVTAHIDTKVGTPGALDNAAGVAVVLLVAEMLDTRAPTGVELVVLNGEDYFNAAGEVQYLSEHGGDLGDVALAVNIDAAGYREGRTAYSLYGCDERLAAHVRAVLDGHGLVEGPQWWQGDHTIFAMHGRPAVALTSERLDTINQELLHSADDTVEQVDVSLLVQAAQALCEMIEHLSPADTNPTP
ncbi:MAG: M28 family peptidase [Chloroflexi bacterium]|nr:M28 family peptidase [Chloroflexota bacterium]